MVMHMNFGSAGGAATFTVHDPDGKQAEFGYQYDTRKGGRTGFTLDGIKERRRHSFKGDDGSVK
jgi:hypothetical protein